MIYLLLKVTLALALLYFLYEKVFKLYYKYWYFTRQGIPCIGLPVPLLGNLLTLKKALKNMTPYSKSPSEEYWNMVFGPKIPKLFLDFRNPEGILVVSDPETVNELYITKNKYFDKNEKSKRAFS
jgi:hypothetical protein